MIRSRALPLAVAGALFALTAGGARALPAQIGTTAVTPSTALLRPIDYRRCWYDDGVRVCRWVHDYDDYDDFDGGYGGGPFGFYFGGPSIGFGHFGGGGHFGGHAGGHGGHGGHGRR